MAEQLHTEFDECPVCLQFYSTTPDTMHIPEHRVVRGLTAMRCQGSGVQRVRWLPPKPTARCPACGIEYTPIIDGPVPAHYSPGTQCYCAGTGAVPYTGEWPKPEQPDCRERAFAYRDNLIWKVGIGHRRKTDMMFGDSEAEAIAYADSLNDKPEEKPKPKYTVEQLNDECYVVGPSALEWIARCGTWDSPRSQANAKLTADALNAYDTVPEGDQ